ncbi:MAG: aldo/keto reductase [Lentisphaeria bacterium]|nr:aldo/keto reductase [Lentisphaeria bacterium]
MKMQVKTLANGFAMPVLGMGTWQFGGRQERNPENDDAGQIAALQAGIEAGFTLIDTAEYYADGYAETLVGKAIAGVPREKLFLTSKVWKTHLRRDDVLRSAENSLKRLGTDHFDLYLYHQIDDSVPLEETIGALNELADSGLTRHIGVSNFAPERLVRAIRCSGVPIAVNQVHYSLKVREPEAAGLAECCREHDVLLQAWRPLRGVEACPLTEELCRKYGVTLPQLALSWLISQENVTAITAMKNPAHIPDNLKALDIRLSEADIERLRTEYPEQSLVSAVPLR